MSDEPPGEAASEGRFTPATTVCPHPERWSSTDVDSTEVEVSELVAALVRALQPDIVVETGSAWGQTAQMIGEALDRNGQGRLYSLEIDPDRVDYTRKRCIGLPVEVWEGSSLEWTPPGKIGFAFFDSFASLRVPEFRRYHPDLIPGSVVAFHDSADHHGYYPQILELEDEGLLLPIRLPTPRGICIAEVL